MPTAEGLLRPNEVAAMLRVSVPTLANWEDHGWLVSVPREAGEHRRYRREDVEKLMRGEGQ